MACLAVGFVADVPGLAGAAACLDSAGTAGFEAAFLGFVIESGVAVGFAEVGVTVLAGVDFLSVLLGLAVDFAAAVAGLVGRAVGSLAAGVAGFTAATLGLA